MSVTADELAAFPDEMLIAEIQDGSVLAFQAIVRRYEARLLFYVRRITRDEATAEEVVQDTFFKLYRTIGRVDLEQRFSTYLFTIAKNTAITALRATRMELPLDEATMVPSAEDLNVVADQSMLSEQMKGLLAKLNDTYRQVIELYYFQHLSYEEVQARTGLPLNTVRTNLRRAKHLLRRSLTDG